MRTFARAVLLFLLLILTGCVTSPIPPGYTGPTARLLDYGEMETGFRAIFFYVSEVNGKPIKTSLNAAREINYGRGFSMTPQSITRLVPPGKMTLKLEGRHAYGAPIQELVMAATMRSVTETYEVDLKPDVLYQVRGVLADGKDEIWLEVFDTGERIGRKVPGK